MRPGGRSTCTAPFTGLYSAFWLGTRSLETMREAGILSSFAGIVVSGRYAGYCSQTWQGFAGHQACAGTCPGAAFAAGREHPRRAAGDGGAGRVFLESTFLGLWLFGWDKLPRRVHLLTIWAVSFGSVLSAAFILAANSWMQHPVGYIMVKGKPQPNDVWALFTDHSRRVAD